MVSVSTSVNLPLHHKVQKFSSCTGAPGWSRKKGRKNGCGVVVVAWSVGLSVTLVSTAETAEPIEMSFGFWAQMGPRNHVLNGNPDPHRNGQLWGKWVPIIKYRDTLRSHVRKWLNQLSCRLDCDLRMAQGIINEMRVEIHHEKGQF